MRIYDYYRSLPGYFSIIANISLVVGIILLFFDWYISIFLFILVVALWSLSASLHRRSLAKQNRNLSGTISTLQIVLDRTLEGVRLGTTIEIFESTTIWKEMTGEEKSTFGPGFSGEKLFKMLSDDKLIVCSCVFGEVFKIGMQAPNSYADFYMNRFANSYGLANINEHGWYEWEDANTCLQIIVSAEESLLNVLLTDKKLLIKAWQELYPK